MIKISIIVPVYNAEKYINKCIDSLVNQTLREIEIILVNDGSTDKSHDFCLASSKKYRNIKYFRIQNSGCSFARNYGIKKAIGEYITFVDADDWIEKDMYLQMYQKSKTLNLDILICGYKKIQKNKGVILEVLPELRKNNSYIDSKTNWFNSSWNKIYKRTLLEKNDIKFLEKCHMGEDMVFNFKAFKCATKISVIQEKYYNYFINEGSVTENPDKKKEIYKALKEIKKIGVTYKEFDECVRYHGIIYPFGLIEKIKEEKGEWKEYQKEFLQEIKCFKEELSLKTKATLLYRRIRVKFVFLKKYLKDY